MRLRCKSYRYYQVWLSFKTNAKWLEISFLLTVGQCSEVVDYKKYKMSPQNGDLFRYS
jgi:hypothetical protein